MHRVITRILVAASVLVVVLGATPGVAAAAPSPSFAVFEWHTLSQVNARVSDQRLSSLRAEGFKAVYANVGDYLEVADQPDSRTQRTRLNQLKRDLKRFVARASKLGFAVHAVGGGPNWTDASHRYLGPKLVELVADYNGAVAPNERLQGVQLDIEPVRRSELLGRRGNLPPGLPLDAPEHRGHLRAGADPSRQQRLAARLRDPLLVRRGARGATCRVRP